MGDPPGKQWMDEHFKNAGPARDAASAKRPSSLAGASVRAAGWLTLLLAVCAGGWALAEYFRLIDTGWWPWAKVPLDETTSALAIDEPAAPSDSPAPAPALDANQRRQLENQRSRLTEGVRLLSKDLSESEAAYAPFAAQIRISSDRVQQLENYASTTAMTSQQQWDYRNSHRDAVADLNNSRGRAKELADKCASLKRRLDQAKTDLTRVDQQLGLTR